MRVLRFLCLLWCSFPICFCLAAEETRGCSEECRSSPYRTSSEELFLFVSFSIPDEGLLALAEQSKHLPARFVFRGFPDPSSPESFLLRILTLQEKGLTVETSLDPALFAEYQVARVPCFVLRQGDRFDKVCGHLPIESVLHLFSKRGETKHLASRLLTKRRAQ